MSKNRSTKRLFAVALSLVMVLALLPMTALADVTNTLTATPTKGATDGTTQITITESIGANNSRVYTVGSQVTAVPDDTQITNGTPFTAGADIPVKTGEYVTIYEIDESNVVMAYVSVQIDADNIQEIEVTGVTITGTAKVGSTLTATVEPATATAATYQWQSADAASGSYSDITANATGSTYKPVAGDLGKFIKVVVTSSGGNSETSKATEVAVVAADPDPTSVPPQVIVPEKPETPDVIEGTPDDGLTEEDEDGTGLEEEEDIVDDIVDDVPETGDSAVNAVWAVLVSTLVLGAAVAFVMKKKAADNC